MLPVTSTSKSLVEAEVEALHNGVHPAMSAERYPLLQLNAMEPMEFSIAAEHACDVVSPLVK
jgi:hypothetical protein